MRSDGWVIFWGFQLLFGGLFAAVFLVVLPSILEGWFYRGLSIVLGAFVGLSVVFVCTFALWGWLVSGTAKPWS